MSIISNRIHNFELLNLIIMSEETIQEQQTQQPNAQKNGRSASYPGLTVSEAFTFTNSVYEKFSTADVTRKEIATAIKRHPTGISRDIAAAAAFGFLEKNIAKGELEAKYKITKLFSDLLRPENEKEKKIAIITAFGKPKLYQDLIAKFDGQVIPETLVNTLIKHHAITVNASQECADLFVKSGIEAGVINENRVLNYRVVLSATSKTQYAEVIEETSHQNDSSQNARLPVKVESASYATETDNKIPIHLTKNKMAYMVYPQDINDKDIKLLDHAIKGILLRLELEEESNNPKIQTE